jgi:hypothetical protein
MTLALSQDIDMKLVRTRCGDRTTGSIIRVFILAAPLS